MYSVADLTRRWNCKRERVERFMEAGLLRAIVFPPCNGMRRAIRFTEEAVELFEKEHGPDVVIERRSTVPSSIELRARLLGFR